MLVRDRMTKPVHVITPDVSIDDARAVLRRHKIHHLPVAARGRLAGVISDRDVRNPPRRAGRVADVMTTDPAVVAPTAPVDEAAHLMRTRRINSLPVVDRGRIIGILTSSDVLDAFVELSGVTQPSYTLVVEARGQRNVESQVRKIIAQNRGRLSWLHHKRQRGRNEVSARLQAPRVDDIVTALEAAGFEVCALLATTGRLR